MQNNHFSDFGFPHKTGIAADCRPPLRQGCPKSSPWFEMRIIKLQEEPTEANTIPKFFFFFFFPLDWAASLICLTCWASTVCQAMHWALGHRSKPDTDPAVTLPVSKSHRCWRREPIASANSAVLLLNVDENSWSLLFPWCHLWRQSLWRQPFGKSQHYYQGFTELEVPTGSMALLKGSTNWFSKPLGRKEYNFS